MATVKIDTAVDSAAFSAFFTLFQKFQAGVEQQPDAWGKVAAAGGEARGSLEDAARSVRTLADNMDDILHRVRGLDNETEKVSRRWTSLARGTKEAAGHIKDATGSLLKWAGITGLVAGVAGFGAEHLMFGLGRGVSANRSAAMGAGTSYGGLQAARLAYGRYGSGEGMLGKIADAQGDPSQRLPFGAVGMGAKDYAGRDSADVLADFMKRAKDTLDKIPDEELGSRLRVTHLGDFMSLEEARRMKSDSRENVYGQADSIAGNKRVLNLDPKVQLQWQKFTTAMERAGTTMETMLVNRLVALEPGLLKLSESATKIAETFLKQGGAVDTWLGEIDHGMEWLANNIDKPEFQDRISGFVTAVGELGTSAWGLAKGAAKLLHWLAKLVNDNDASTDMGKSPITDAANARAAGLSGGGGNWRGGALGQGADSLGTDASSSQGFRGGNTDVMMRAAKDQLRKEGVPEEHLQAAAAALIGNVMQESKGNPNAVHDHGTGYGIYGARLGRRDGMLSWLRENKYAANSDEGQARYMAHEAMTAKAYARTAAALRNATHENLGAVTNTVATNFESPAPATANYGGRRNNAAAAEASAGVSATGLRNRAPTVIINKNTGANPPALAAAAAAPQ